MDNRQKELLKEIVESYIKNVKPVGSQALCKKFKLSSATIRNEMADLEKMGYLDKTHTSSGRIPSEKGYRYYVDNIMKPKELTGDDMLKLQTIFKNTSLILDDYITKSVEIVSEMTNLTAIVLGKSSSENRISKVEIVPINENNLQNKEMTFELEAKEVKNIKIKAKVNLIQENLEKDLNLIAKVETKIGEYTFSKSNELINQATEQIANLLNVSSKEIIYTSGSSESNNLAIKGIALKYKNRGNHIITTNFEHSSIYGPIDYLVENGFKVSFVKLDQNGLVDLNDLKNLMTDETILVSINMVNSEIGIKQNINEIGEFLKEYPKCFFHIC